MKSHGSRERKIKSYAKVNLSLDIIGIRDDGYHLIETVMQQIRLADNIYIKWNETDCEGISVSLTTSKPYLPTDERNLAYRAAILMSQYAKVSGKLNIRIEKKIPVAAGLGGGSSNAAAVMVELNRLWHTGFNTRELCEISKPLGADVPFLVLTHNTEYECAMCTGVGDELKALRYGMRSYIVLAKPAFGISTKEVFQNIDKYEIGKRPNGKALIYALKHKKNSDLFDNMVNVLEEYTLNSHPAVADLKKKIGQTAGVKAVLMSGSGPTVFGVFDTRSAARNSCMLLRAEGYEAYWTQTMKEVGGRKNAEF